MGATTHAERPVLAVFDFDGTLTTRDSSLPFLAFAAGRGRLVTSLLLRGPFLLADLTEALGGALRASDGPPAPWDRWELAVHRRLLRALFRGRPRGELTELGRRFASEALDELVTPDGLAQLHWHLERGHRCLLVTGSLDAYMQPWGMRAGFERVLATRLAHAQDETVQGDYDGQPCWGQAKLLRLREAVGDLEGYTLVVYGNEPSDGPLLDAADHAVRVRPGDSWTRLSASVREALAVGLVALACGCAASGASAQVAGPLPPASKSQVDPRPRPAPPVEGERAHLTGAALLVHADSLLQADHIEEALRVLEAQLGQDPADFDARWRASRAAVYLGILASGTDEENAWYRRAIVHADRALEARPDDREALHWAFAAKGNLAVQTGVRESASLGGDVWDLAQHALQLSPDDAYAHYALGKLEYELLKLNSMQKLISRPFRRGELSHLSWVDALAYGQRAVELDASSSLFRLGLADTLWRMDRKAEATAQLEVARDLPLRTPVDRDFHDRAELLLRRIAEGIDPTK